MIKLLFLLLLAPVLASSDKQCSSISIEKVNLCVELAISQREKSKGLMYRKDLSNSDGMLFVWKNAGKRCMWMKNTSIPLSVAYLSKSGHILEIHDLKPFSEKSVCSNQKARMALEMKQGWFQDNKIGVGQQLKIN